MNQYYTATWMMYTVLVLTSQCESNNTRKDSEVIKSTGHLPIKMWQYGLQSEKGTNKKKRCHVLFSVQSRMEQKILIRIYLFILFFNAWIRVSNLSDSKFKKDRKGSFFLLQYYSLNTVTELEKSEKVLEN